MTKMLVKGKFLLEKFPGKGGWTYAALPGITQDKSKPFGWLTVKGSIDGYELKHYKLMPMGKGQLFLPVKASIRKKIKKEAGDVIDVILYKDDSIFEMPDEIIECFNNEPKASLASFLGFSEGEQKTYIDWIYTAKTEETKVRRIFQMMDRLKSNLKFHDK